MTQNIILKMIVLKKVFTASASEVALSNNRFYLLTIRYTEITGREML